MASAPVPFLPTGRAQPGFLNRALYFPLQVFISLLRAGENVIFTGHSLGGAVSALLTIRLLEALMAVPGHTKISKERVKCIIFGTGAFANAELRDYVNLRYRDFFYHLVSKNDFVPRLHTTVEKFWFPACKQIVKTASDALELQIANRLIERVAGLHFPKLILRLEQGPRSFWLIKFVQVPLDCAAENGMFVCYYQCRNLVLLDPEAQGNNKSLRLDQIEELSLAFTLQWNSWVEHGLASYYKCLVHYLSDSEEQALSLHKLQFEQSCSRDDFSSEKSLYQALSPRESTFRCLQTFILYIYGIILGVIARIFIRGTANEFQA